MPTKFRRTLCCDMTTKTWLVIRKGRVVQLFFWSRVFGQQFTDPWLYLKCEERIRFNAYFLVDFFIPSSSSISYLKGMYKALDTEQLEQDSSKMLESFLLSSLTCEASGLALDNPLIEILLALLVLIIICIYYSCKISWI